MDIHIEVWPNGASGPQVLCGTREDGFKTVTLREHLNASQKATCPACLMRLSTINIETKPRRIWTSRGYVTL